MLAVLDFEVYSSVDIRNHGAARFLADEKAEPVTAALGLFNSYIEPEKVTYCVYNLLNEEELRKFLLQVAPATTIIAHNALFERAVCRRWFPELLPKKWKDTMDQAAILGLPLKLEHLSRVLKTSPKDTKTGNLALRALMAQDSAKQTPLKLAESLKEYCKQDVISTYEIHQVLSGILPPNERHQRMAEYTRVLNERGFPVDVEAALILHNHAGIVGESLDKQMLELTGCRVNQSVSLKKWIQEQGVFCTGVGKPEVERMLARPDIPGNVQESLSALQNKISSPAKKFEFILENEVGGRIYGGLQFNGAITGRWSGRGFQPQNLPRYSGSLEDIDISRANKSEKLSIIQQYSPAQVRDSIRRCITAPEGKTLIGADYANIEGRVAAVFCGCHEKVSAYRAFDRGESPDLYRVAYASIANKNPEDVTKDERAIGKQLELSCQYGMGSQKFYEIVTKNGLKVQSSTEAERFLNLWRNSRLNRGIVQAWNELINKFSLALHEPGKKIPALEGVCSFEAVKTGRTTMRLHLPSGRIIFFMDVRNEGGSNLSYRKYSGYTPLRRNVYGGLLLDYLVQGSAADIMLQGMTNFERPKNQITPIMTVHDEVIAEINEESPLTPGEFCKILCDMTALPPIFMRIPLAAEGWRSRFYGK